MHYRQIQSLPFLCLEILKLLGLNGAVAKSVEPITSFTLPFALVSDFHELLSPLSLAINPLQNTLLIALKNAETSFKRLQHARVFIFDSLCED